MFDALSLLYCICKEENFSLLSDYSYTKSFKITRK